MRSRSEQGQVLVLVVGLALVCFAVAGLAVDGTRAFLARRTLQQTADAACLAAASEIDVAAYYESGGDAVRLHPVRARSVARAWLERSRLRVDVSVVVDATEVRVVLRTEVPTTFLGLVGISRVPVAVETASAPVAGRSP